MPICCWNAGPPSNQHWVSVSTDADLLLKCWPTIKSTLGQCLNRCLFVVETLAHHWFNIGSVSQPMPYCCWNAGPPSNQHWVSVSTDADLLLKRWPTIKLTLSQCLNRCRFVVEMLAHHQFNIGSVSRGFWERLMPHQYVPNSCQLYLGSDVMFSAELAVDLLCTQIFFYLLRSEFIQKFPLYSKYKLQCFI